MTTDELEREMSTLLATVQEQMYITDAQDARWGRVSRELARRDYRFREHGKTCVCSDCWYLAETWRATWRRTDEETITALEAWL